MSEELEMVDLSELGNLAVRGKYRKYVEAAVANPGKAILVPVAKQAQQIRQGEYAKRAGVKATERNGKVYVFRAQKEEA